MEEDNYAPHVEVGVKLVVDQGLLSLTHLLLALFRLLVNRRSHETSWELHVCSGVQRQIWRPFRYQSALLPLLS